MSVTSLDWYTLRFPIGVAPEPVANVLRTLASEPRGGWRTRRLPVVVETELRQSGVIWRIGATPPVIRGLQQAAERELPGLEWTPTPAPSHEPSRVVEVRVTAQQRLLATNLASATSQRLLGTTAELHHGETLLVQWQIGSWLARAPIAPARVSRPTRTIWNLIEPVDPDRSSEEIAAARQKTAEHVFAVVGRIAVGGASGERAHQLVAYVGGALQLLRAPGVGVTPRALPSWLAAKRLSRYEVPAFDPPCRFTANELAGVIGWPLGNPRLRGVAYVVSRALPLDERSLLRVERAERSDRIVGESAYPSQAGQLAVLRSRESLRHLHLIGPSGVGKSTLLTHLILADVAAGRAVVAIDPKGDLVTDVVARLPEQQRQRVVVLDPSDPAPVGFNPLSGGAVGIDGVLHVLRSVWADSWGPRLNDVLHAGLLTLAASPGHTLAELPLLLTEASFRRPLVGRATAADPLGLGTFWPWFESLSPDMRSQVLSPVMSRMRAVLLRPDLRAVLAQPEPRFELRNIFHRRSVLLVRLSKGQIGSDGSQLLGSLLVAQLWRLGQGRTAIPASRRHLISLVLDEFQEFLRLPLDLADVLVQARGLGVGLTLAHQHLGQLDSSVKAAVLANAGSRIIFHTDYDDAGVLAKRSAGQITPEDLMGLEPFHAYASLLAGDATTPYGSLHTRPLDSPSTDVNEVLQANRERYGIARETTEAHLTGLLRGGRAHPDSSNSGALGARRVNRGAS